MPSKSSTKTKIQTSVHTNVAVWILITFVTLGVGAIIVSSVAGGLLSKNNSTMKASRSIDIDDDGIISSSDNCPEVSNAVQQDADQDSRGDVCDNCPSIINPDQSDTDEDHIGDLCDNCPYLANNDQMDSDGDGSGDICDADIIISGN